MEGKVSYFGTMGAIGLVLLALFLLDRVLARRERKGWPRREGTVELGLFLVSFLALFLLNKHNFV